MHNVILYIATSEDGYIADCEGGVDWLPQPSDAAELEAVGYPALMERIGTIIMGRRSYEQIITFGDWAWPDKDTLVFTSKPFTPPLSCIACTADSPKTCLETLKKQPGKKDIWLLGGAELARSFVRDNLVDEIILTIVPTRLGEGIALDIPLDAFYLNNEKACMDGIVQKVYLLRKPRLT